jgi:hypothetical protein
MKLLRSYNHAPNISDKMRLGAISGHFALFASILPKPTCRRANVLRLAAVALRGMAMRESSR